MTAGRPIEIASIRRWDGALQTASVEMSPNLANGGCASLAFRAERKPGH